MLVRDASGRPELSFSPGLIGTEDAAFRDARKPLAAEFLFRGQRLFVIIAPLTPGSGDPAHFGRAQPPRRAGEAARLEQARALHRFAAAILARDRGADIVVLGGLHDPAWAPSSKALKGALLLTSPNSGCRRRNATPRAGGNSIDLDHIIVSKSLLEEADARLEIVHRYSEHPLDSRQGDNDPVLASFRFR